MDNYERLNRIQEALNLRNMKAVELSEKSGVSKSSLSHYIAQRWQPKQKALAQMAKTLEVSDMWLAGYDVPMERPVVQTKMDALGQVVNIIRKDDRLTNLVINLSHLNDAQLSTVESMVNELVKLNHQH